MGLLLFALGLVFSLLLAASLWIDVLNRIEGLASSRSDNTQWTLSQLEVDQLRLQLAADDADDGTRTALQELRLRYDILYSRFYTLGRAETYQRLYEDTAYADAYGSIDAALGRMLPHIDSPDAELSGALIEIQATTAELHSEVRTLALRGLDVFAEVSDLQRTEIVALITRTGLVTVLLLVVLAIAVFLILQNWRGAMTAARRTVEANRDLALIVDTSLDAIVVSDEQGVVRTYNPAAEQVFGWTREEAIGRPMTELMIPEHHHAAHYAGMERYRRGGPSRVVGNGRVQLDARHKSGHIFPVEMSLSTDENASDRVFVAFLRDISERQQAEDALIAARDDALAAARKKAEFLAVMSHEIRTPLNGMLGAAQLLEVTGLTELQRKYAKTLQFSGQLLLRHVNDVLDISRLDAGETGLSYDLVNLRALCAQVMENQRGDALEANNRLRIDVAESVPQEVLTDGGRLAQVLLNIVGNANKFTQDGLIELSMRAETAASGKIRLEIAVTDNGIGIPVADRERVFEEFVMLDSSYERKTDGTGLGLAISRRIIRAMGGQVGIREASGGGAQFWISLDVDQTPPDAERPALPPIMESCPKAQISILILEDNYINREILREMLVQDGHRVCEAEDGQTGVNSASVMPFDLIFVDISMPGMDGISATQAIRESNGPNALTPIVAVTAHAMPEEVASFRKAGMSYTLTKPIDRQALRAVIQATQGKTGAQPASPVVKEMSIKRATIPLMDESRLADLIESMGQVRLLNLLDQFTSQGDALAVASDCNGPRYDVEAFIAAVHALAGSAGMIGATALYASLADIETAFKSTGIEPDAKTRTSMCNIWADTRKALNDLLEDLHQPES